MECTNIPSLVHVKDSHLGLCVSVENLKQDNLGLEGDFKLRVVDVSVTVVDEVNSLYAEHELQIQTAWYVC